MRRTLRDGDQGAIVGELQQLLNRAGAHLKQDRDWGPATDRAVEQYQLRTPGLEYDYRAQIVGPATWAELEPAELGDQPIGELLASIEGLQTERRELFEDLRDRGLPGTAGFAAAVAFAQFLGAREDPDGSNVGPEIAPLVDGYPLAWGLPSSYRGAWCVMACSSAIRISCGIQGLQPDDDARSWRARWALTPLGAFMGGAAQLEDWAIEEGRFDSSPTCARTGQLFTIGRAASGSDPSDQPDARHAGMVLWDNLDGTFATVEGNASNAVLWRTRTLVEIRGLITWWDE
jgi:hypothetical protein